MIPVFSHGLLKLTVLGKLKLCDIAARSKVKKTNHLKRCHQYKTWEYIIVLDI